MKRKKRVNKPEHSSKLVIVLRSIHRVEKYIHLEREKPLKYIFVMIVFVHMFTQREYDLYFYVKRDSLLFSVNVKLFFGFCVMREKANYFCVKVFSEKV